MWIKSHTTIATGITPEQIWRIWSDINMRPEWDLDIEWAEIKGPFVEGAVFHFKPKGGPKLAMTITECIPLQRFTDCYKIPFARLYGTHEMESTNAGLKITTSIKVEGLLGFVLRKLVGEKVAREVPEQTAMLIKLAESK